MRSVLSGSLISALAMSGYAFAQESNEETSDDSVALIEEIAEEEEARQDKIVVTGSLIARDEFSSASPIQVITAEVATLEGLIDTASLIQGSSLASGSTQLNNTFQNFVTNGGVGTETIDLRGCGDTRTLVLIDGKRPGPSGTRGAVSALDLNVVPRSIVSRVDILKDGASTIYGSDAVCGVVNIITRDTVEDLEITGSLSRPFDSGAEDYTINAAWGFEIGDNADFTLSAEYRMRSELNQADRDYLDCPRDYVRDPNGGGLIDRLNLSADGNRPDRNCSNLYIDTVIDLFSGERLVPNPTGETIPTAFGGTIPGYKPRVGTGVLDDGRLFYEDILNPSFAGGDDVIPSGENLSIFATADIELGDIVWDSEFLYSRRETEVDGHRQFFPIVGSSTTPFGVIPAYGYIADPTYSNDLNSLARPVLPFSNYDKIVVDYYQLSSSLSGGYGNVDFLDGWSWKIDGTFSRGEGEYTGNEILISRSGDWRFDGTDFDGDGTVDLVGPPTLNYLDPGFLSGERRAELQAGIGAYQTGETVYEQTTITAVTTGEIFELPAGPVGLGLGLEYREFSIDDTPGELTQSGDIWGSSTAGPTRGENTVTEAFAEVVVPIFKGQRFAEDLEFTGSVRAFEYDLGGSDSIYKAGLNWQITPVLRARSSFGTSYRAPALFELFLQDQTAFADQIEVDPCIQWGETTNQNIRTNCAAIGIAPDYNGGASSALVTTSGGGDALESETGETFTAGIVITPVNSALNIAIDYYEVEIEDQISTLSAQQITFGCYATTVFPNDFCNRVTREPADGIGLDDNSISAITAETLNVDSQSQRGIDLEVLYERDFDFGTVTLDASVSWSLERFIQVFQADIIDGIDNNDFNGTVGFPSVVGDAAIRLERGDWTYSWFTDFIGRQDDNRYFEDDLNQPADYLGLDGLYKVYTEAQFEHGASVAWEGDTWEFAVGIRNIFDEHPPQVSDVIQTSAGNSPLAATGYDIRGRRVFTTISKTF